MYPTTPSEITRPVKRLIEKVVPGGNGIYLSVTSDTGAIVKKCFSKLQTKLERDGGQMLYSWQMWEWPHVLVLLLVVIGLLLCSLSLTIAHGVAQVTGDDSSPGALVNADSISPWCVPSIKPKQMP